MLVRAVVKSANRKGAAASFGAVTASRWTRGYAKDDRPHRAPPKPPPYAWNTLEPSDAEEPILGPIKNQTWSPQKPITFAPKRSEGDDVGGRNDDHYKVSASEIEIPDVVAVGKSTEDVLVPSGPTPQSRTTLDRESQSSKSPAAGTTKPGHHIKELSLDRDEAQDQDNTTPSQVADTLAVPPDVKTASQDLGVKSSTHQGIPTREKEDTDTAHNADTVPAQEAFDEQPSSETTRHIHPSEGETLYHQQAQKMTAQDHNPPISALPDLRQGIPSTFDPEFLKTSSSFKDQATPPPSLNITQDPTSPVTAVGGQGGGELPKDAYISSIDRRRNALARYLYIAFTAFLSTGALYFGQNWSNEEEARSHPDAPNGWSPAAFYSRIKVRLSKQLGYYTEPAFPKLLPDMEPNVMRAPYTLVLSLEDLLVSSKWSRDKGWEVAKRPGVDYFLRYLSQYYEIVVFTSVQSMNADLVIRKLDPYRATIMWPLFREATRYINGVHVKDLSYLNRDLSKTLIIDTVPAHTQLQPENAIILPKWDGQPAEKSSNARDLVALIPFLEYIGAMYIDDVRKVIESYKDADSIPLEFARREAKAREAFNKELAEQKAKRRGATGGEPSWLASLLGIKPMAAHIPGEESPAEALVKGKMLSDQARERGQRQWEMIDREIRENGEKWLEEMAAEEKKAQEEHMKSMQGSVAGYMSNVFGFFGGGGGGSTSSPAAAGEGKK